MTDQDFEIRTDGSMLTPASRQLAVVSLRNVTRSYKSEDDGTVDILKGINLDIWPGTLNVIRGESGSGKTTLLRILGMLDTQFDGSYLVEGEQVDGAPDWKLDELRANNIGFIFQEGRLFDHMTLRRNVEIPLELQGIRDRTSIDGRIGSLESKLFDSDEEAQNSPLPKLASAVSGGQKQRASVMRAMVTEPAIILADEPTASLHESKKLEIVEYLVQKAREGQTIVVVSHDKVFYDVGHQLVLEEGQLFDITADGSKSRTPASVPEPKNTTNNGIQTTEMDGRAILWGWKPRAPLSILVAQAWREVFTRKLFLGLILTALIVGVCQVSVFTSVIVGADSYINARMTEGSRLNRIEIKPKARNRAKKDRFPQRDEFAEWPQVDQIVPRRTALAIFVKADGLDVTFTAMGLHSNDPEYKLLDFVGGGAFTGEHDKLEVIITASLLTDLFADSDISTRTKPENAKGEEKNSFNKFVGRTVTTKLNQYDNRGKLASQTEVPLKVVGIILNGEGGRQLYMPNKTQLVFDQFKKDREGEIDLDIDMEAVAWRNKAEIMKVTDFPWEDRLQVYATEIKDVLPIFRDLSKNGYKPKSDIWQFKWALDIQDTAWRVFMPLLALIVISVILTVAANIYTSAKLRERELALWRVIGMRRGDLVITQLISTFISVLLGAVSGLVVGSFLINYTRDMLAKRAQESAEASGLDPQNFDAIFAPLSDFVWIVLPVALLLGLAASIYPSLRTARTDPAKVLQS